MEDDALSGDIQFLLDGLEVVSISELRRLVLQGRYYEQMHADGFRLAEPPFRDDGDSSLSALVGVPLS